MHIQCSLPASITSLARLFTALGLGCFLLCLLSACASNSEKVGQYAVSVPQLKAEQAAAAVTVGGDGQPVEGAALTYLLQPGDQVDVKFFYNPELNEQLVIGPDNNVALQLIGELNVRGMSVRQLTNELTRRYAVTLRNPQATVILRKYALSRIFVSGEVNNPAAHVLDQSSLTAFQAILQSGGFRKGAERRQVIVLRNSGSSQPLFIKLDLQAHLEQTAESDILLRPYDIVFVPQRRIAEVADFFDEYINKILPIYRNLGFSFTYETTRK
jgi:protein involved in polysaccharide export with SLBB domain